MTENPMIWGMLQITQEMLATVLEQQGYLLAGMCATMDGRTRDALEKRMEDSVKKLEDRVKVIMKETMGKEIGEDGK